MTLVSTVTVGAGGAASIDFTSIPQTGTDLLVVVSLRSTNADFAYSRHYPYLNGNVGTFTTKNLIGTGSAASSTSGSGGWRVGYMPTSLATTNTFDNSAYYIPNYAATVAKSVSIDSIMENNATLSYQTIAASLWSLTSAITAFGIKPENGTLAEGSTASLYTIQKGSGGAVVS